MGLHEVRIGGSSEGSKASCEQFPTVAELEVPFALGWNNNARACVCAYVEYCSLSGMAIAWCCILSP